MECVEVAPKSGLRRGRVGGGGERCRIGIGDSGPQLQRRMGNGVVCMSLRGTCMNDACQYKQCWWGWWWWWEMRGTIRPWTVWFDIETVLVMPNLILSTIDARFLLIVDIINFASVFNRPCEPVFDPVLVIHSMTWTHLGTGTCT